MPTYGYMDSEEIIEDLRSVLDEFPTDADRVRAIRARLPATIEEGVEVEATATVTYVNGDEVEIEIEIGGEMEVITIPVQAAVSAQR